MQGGLGLISAVPAPFLVKTYEMVDDSSTDRIVSWSPTNKSFIVWNPLEFGRLLLPTYFKHSNFSSFVRQVNAYGFRKMHPERWEFANENFVRDRRHLLMNIHRRKPVHRHSHHPEGTLVDAKRAALEEQVKMLLRDKTAIESYIFSFKENQSAAKTQLEDIEQRLDLMEERQNSMLNLLEKALQDPNVVEKFSRKIDSVGLTAYNRKRKLPQIEVDRLQPVADENTFIDSPDGHGTEFQNVFDQDFSNKVKLELSPIVGPNGYGTELQNDFDHDFAKKVKLELSPTVSDMNLVSPNTRGSDEHGESLHGMLFEEETEGLLAGLPLPLTPETLKMLADTDEEPLTPEMDSCLWRRETGDESPKLHSLEPSSEECDSHMSSYSVRSPQIDYQDIEKLAQSTKVDANDKESDGGACSNRNVADEGTNLVSSQQEVPLNIEVKPEVPARRGNDPF